MPNIPINTKSNVIPALPTNIKVFRPYLKLNPKPTRVAIKLTEHMTAVIYSESSPFLSESSFDFLPLNKVFE